LMTVHSLPSVHWTSLHVHARHLTLGEFYKSLKTHFRRDSSVYWLFLLVRRVHIFLLSILAMLIVYEKLHFLFCYVLITAVYLYLHVYGVQVVHSMKTYSLSTLAAQRHAQIIHSRHHGIHGIHYHFMTSSDRFLVPVRSAVNRI